MTPMKFILPSLIIGTTASKNAAYRLIDDWGWPLLIVLSIILIVGSATEAIWYYRRRKKQETVVCGVLAIMAMSMLSVQIIAMLFPSLLQCLP